MESDDVKTPAGEAERTRPFRFPKEARLRKTAEFDRVFEAGNRLSDERMTLLFVPNGAESSRLGIVAGRKVGKAVVRNRTKRVIREAFRLLRPGLPSGYDLVVIPRPLKKGWDLEGARESLRRLASKIDQREQTC